MVTNDVGERLAGLREQAGRWLDLCGRLVSVDSGPGDLGGANRMVDILSDVWTGAGCVVETVGDVPPVLVARRTGPGPRVLMVGHYDTVFSSGAADARPFSVQGSRASGAGAADMKAGLVVQAAAMAATSDQACDITVLINGDEESGSVGSRSIIESFASRADIALVFEPGEPDGALVVGRPGVRRFRLSTRGRAAHTGVDPEKGRNAIEGIAHLVLAIQGLGRRGDLGTVTVAQIMGGSRPNVVPAESHVVVDARIPDEAAGDRLAAELDGLAGDVPVRDVTASVEPLENRPPLVPDRVSKAIAARLGRLAAEAGLTIEARHARGSSDGNFTSALGVPTLDGLGPPGGGFHTEDEWLEVDGIFTRAALISGLLERIGAGDPPIGR